MTVVSELDTSTPNGARAYNGLLGALEPLLRPDREMNARLEAVFPPGEPGPRDLAIANRVYLQRAVSQAVHGRARQVLDLGAGYPVHRLQPRGAPALRPLHEEARKAHPEARCAYVDRDLQVVSHGRAAVRGIPGVTYALADLADVAAVAGCPDVRQVIDWRWPVTVIFGLTLHFWSASEARRIVQGYLNGMAPGSRLVITVPWWRDEALFHRVQGAYGVAELHNHTRVQVEALFRGTSPLGSGIEVAQGEAGVAGREASACVLGGVGLV